jgi:DMSO reductase family type II enzyme heme b subunit
LPKNQSVRAIGEWKDGRWAVVMTRSLDVGAESSGVSLKPGTMASIAFAIWDGAQRDRDGKKLITIWQDLVLE